MFSPINFALVKFQKFQNLPRKFIPNFPQNRVIISTYLATLLSFEQDR